MNFLRQGGRGSFAGIFSTARALFCLFPLVLLFLFTTPDTGEALVQTVAPRNFYTLDSLLSLTYERYWSSNASFNRFAYGLNMNFNGFVIDPRLIGLTVNGIFSQDFNTLSNSTMDGVYVGISLLQERPKKGFLHYVPQPIELRYQYDSFELGSRQNYGISLIYRPEQKAPAYVEDFTNTSTNRNQNTGNNGQTGDNQNSGNNQSGGNEQQRPLQKKGFSFPLPTFFLDYDRYEFKTDTNVTTHDRLSIRAEALTAHSQSFAEYRLDDYNTGSSKTQLLKLQTNLHYYWKETLTRLDSINTVFLQKTDFEKSVSASNSTSWVRNLGPDGRDTLFIGGGADYLSRDSKSEYGLNLNTGYNKYFSSRFINYASAGVVYAKNEENTEHAETARNNLQYRLSDYLLLLNNATIGQTQDGPLYGFMVGLQVGRVFMIRPAYDIQYSAGRDGESTTTNTFSLDVSSPLLRGMNFFSQNYYRIVDLKGGFSPYREKTLSLSSSFFWAVSRYNLSLGASYVNGSTRDMSVGGLDFPSSTSSGIGHVPGETTSGTTTINAGLSTNLARRLNLDVSAYYQKERHGSARMIFTPLLTWQWRRMYVTARYTLNWAENSVTEHRVFLRVSRQFQSFLRPFL